MVPDSRKRHAGGEPYRAYRCETKHRYGTDACELPWSYRAEVVEGATWDFISGLLADPEELLAGLDAFIEAEKAKTGDPEGQRRALRRQLENLARQRERAQDAYLAGAFELEELNVKVASLEEQRRSVEEALGAIGDGGQKLRELEEMRNFLSGAWVEDLDEWFEVTTPEGTFSVRVPLEDQRLHLRNVAKQAKLRVLEGYTPEQRREAYRDLELKVQARPEGSIILIRRIRGGNPLYPRHNIP
jgi:hypothetical protein